MSREDAKKLFDVPVFADETILQLVLESSMEDSIISMSLDTTAVNTGIVQGVCIWIERVRVSVCLFFLAQAT